MTQITTCENYIYKKPDKAPYDLKSRIIAASNSPISNGFIDFVYSKGIVVGWTEPKVTPAYYGQGTTEMFVLLCHHNEYLSGEFYFDVDVNPGNFSDENQWFDKDGIRRIDEIDVTMVCQYFVGMALYYDVRLIEKVMPLLAPVMLSQNPQRIGDVFRAVRLKLDNFDA